MPMCCLLSRQSRFGRRHCDFPGSPVTSHKFFLRMNDWRNRTGEFLGLADTFRSSGAAAGTNPPTPLSPARVARAPLLSASNVSSSGPIARPQTKFASMAAQLGKDIGRTSEKLVRLMELAKTRSLFSEQTVAPQVQRLTAEVSEDVRNLTKHLEELRAEAENSAAAAPGPKARQAQFSSHAETVVSYLKGRVQTATEQFRDVLQLRTENLKAQQERKQKFAGAPLSTSLASRSLDSPLYQQVRSDGEVRMRHNPPGGDGDVSLPMPQLAVATQERYYGARAEAVTQIERYLGDIQTIFQQLAHLVADQGEMLERIDHNVDTALVDVEQAHGTLSRQLHKMRQNRWLILKIFAVLLVFAVFFLVFFL